MRTATTRTISGRVAANGAGGGSEWTVTRTAVGDYRLSFSPSFRLINVVAAAAAGAAATIPLSHPTPGGPEGTNWRVVMYSTASAAVDQAFTFVAVGAGA